MLPDEIDMTRLSVAARVDPESTHLPSTILLLAVLKVVLILSASRVAFFCAIRLS